MQKVISEYPIALADTATTDYQELVLNLIPARLVINSAGGYRLSLVVPERYERQAMQLI